MYNKKQIYIFCAWKQILYIMELNKKYPRTYHLPFSPGTTSDDKKLGADWFKDYEGKEVDMSIYLNDIPSFQKGVYTVEAYTEQSKLGSAELMLR